MPEPSDDPSGTPLDRLRAGRTPARPPNGPSIAQVAESDATDVPISLSRRAWSASLALAVLLSLLSAAGAAAMSQRPVAPRALVPLVSAPASTSFGTLQTLGANAATEAAAGLHSAMLELSWSQYEPAPGVFDAAYMTHMQAQLAQLRAAGLTVTLGLGLHYTPAWVLALPDGRYVDEHGAVSDQADLVFSQVVRTAATGYLDQVAATLGLAGFGAIRLTAGGDEEMLYPPGGSYWAFSLGAQSGLDRPADIAPNPEPGWRPGTGGLTAAQSAAWLRWYVDGLDAVTGWQMTLLSGLGFDGRFQLVTPGSGVRPDGVTQDVAAGLPDGLAGVGAVWQTYYGDLPSTTGVEAYVSSVADGSGGDDACAAGDDAVALTDPAADAWSATRWISRVADGDGLLKGGENPGFSGPTSFVEHYEDSSSGGLMARSVRQALACGFTDFYWAHDQQLFDGTDTLAAYAALIPAVPVRPMDPTSSPSAGPTTDPTSAPTTTPTTDPTSVPTTVPTGTPVTGEPQSRPWTCPATTGGRMWLWRCLVHH